MNFKNYTHMNLIKSFTKATINPHVFSSVFCFLFSVFFLTLSPVNTSAQLVQGKSKFLGNVIGNIFRSNYSKYWNQVTPGNAGKWGSVEGGQDSYNWTPLDNIYNYAINNNYLYKHHTLIWGQQYPTWITTLDSARQRAQVEEWINLVGQRYPKIDFVDVVNEPLHAPPPYANALGGAGKTGWDWIVTSFELAKKYMPSQAKLILNEYSVLQSNSVTDNFLKIIDTLEVRGLIDAIGIQGHYFEFKGTGYTNDVNTIKYNLNRLTLTGLPVYISEFDINEADDDVQLANYKIYFPIFWENPGVKGMTLWGYMINEMWQPNAFLINERNVERPALQWLRTYIISPFAPKLLIPNGTSGLPRNPVLSWSASDSATSYNVQVSVNNTFVSTVVDTTVKDTLLQLGVLDAGRRYFWRISASNANGTSEFSTTAAFVTGDKTSGVKEKNISPEDFVLFQNYPNPFNPMTKISYYIPKESFVSIKVFNELGQVVTSLVDEVKQAGYYELEFPADNLSSGIYIYQLKTSDVLLTKKMLLLR